MHRFSIQFGLPFLFGVGLLWLTGCGSKTEPSSGPLSEGHPDLFGTMNKVQAAAARSQSSNNLKQMSLACHEYAARNRGLPTQAITDKSGKPLLSWRIALLPQLRLRQLYDQFNLNEPWDSPHNKKLIEKMPAVYQHPMKKTNDGTTCYQCFMGPNTLLSSRPVSFPQITNSDGSGNTILIVEAGKFVPWTKPEDVPYDASKPLPKFGNLYPSSDGFLAAIADGSVRFIRAGISERTLRNAITWNDGNVLGSDW